jgi:HEAT repeat protein
MDNQHSGNSTETDNEIGLLIGQLESKNGLQREQARRKLVKKGAVAAPELSNALHHESKRVRWEAAKALSALAIPATAPALVECLEDEESDVRWTAAEALIDLGPHALGPLLEALKERPKSIRLRERAHQVFKAWESVYAEVVDPVIKAIEDLEPEQILPPAVNRASRLLMRKAAEGKNRGGQTS